MSILLVVEGSVNTDMYLSLHFTSLLQNIYNTTNVIHDPNFVGTITINLYDKYIFSVLKCKNKTVACHRGVMWWNVES